MLILNDENFNKEVEEADLPVLVDFFAVWCGPCQMAGPVIEELAKEYEGKLKVGKLDIDQNPEIAKKHQVMSIPTVLIFKQGEEIKRSVGFPGKEGYRKLIEEAI
ncbi:MAG: thioredoxin [Candidatus Pacebacteria bacterium]|nr:thioredoxin [Candidatus Paceibacterota bacterium]